MKLRNLAIPLFALFMLVACKDEKKADGTDAANAPLPETFDVTFNLTVPADDTFQLYYTEDGSLNFNDVHSVKSVVKGGAAAQDILFKLPEDAVPTNIRLDFGANEAQGEVTVNAMHLKYFDKTFDAKDSLVTKFFYMNPEQLTYDAKTSKVKAVKKPGAAYDPLMWSNEALGEQLKALIK